jgi:hypothetical protein
MNDSLALLCLLVVMIVVVAILGRVTSSGKKPALQAAPRKTGSKIWILYFSIALIIALWTPWGALFFLAVVWLLKQDPKPYSKEIPLPVESEKRTARLLYAWLMLSSFLTIPIFALTLFNLSSDSSTNERVLAALIPLIFHAPLLLGLSSKSTFVFRHSQQAIFLMAIRAAVASLAVSITADPFIGIALFVFGNGALWLFGSVWGWDQVRRGECWFMKRKSQRVISAEAIQVDRELEHMPKSPDAKDVLTAKDEALQIFRTGNPESKKRAVEVLSRLGEVETF